MDMSGETGDPKSFKYKTIFYSANQAYFENFNLVIDTKNVRSAFAYDVYESVFDNITIKGTMESKDSMGPLVAYLSNGVIYKVNSYVDIKFKNLDFSKYYEIAGGIVGQITTPDGNASVAWNNENTFAVIIENSNYYGNIDTDFTNAINGSKYYYLGGLFGCTTYASPAVYFGIDIINSYNYGTYSYTGELPSSVTQYNYQKSDGTMAIAYLSSSIGASSKPIDELAKLGRVHQNIHVLLNNKSIEKVSYGYYGTGSQSNVGSSFWNTVSAPSVVITATKENSSTGKITGLYSDEAYSYREISQNANAEWINVSNKTEITGLSKGTYEIKYNYENSTCESKTFEILETKVTPVAIILPEMNEILYSIDFGYLPAELTNELGDNYPNLSVELTPILETDENYSSDINKIKTAMGSGDVLVSLVDINIILNVGNVSEEVTELSEAIKLKLELPEELKGKGHSFYLINVHEGNAKKISGTVTSDGNYVEFLASEFSTYSLAYTPNPKTGDNVIVYVLALIISSLSIGFLLKRKHN